MKKNTLAVIAVVVAAGIGGAWYMNRGAHAEGEGKNGAAGGAGRLGRSLVAGLIVARRLVRE